MIEGVVSRGLKGEPMKQLLLLGLRCIVALGVGPATSTAVDDPYCQHDLAANSSVLNVDYICRIPTTRHSWDATGNLITDPASPSGYRETQTQVISINFIDYGNPRSDQPAGAATKDVMFVSGRFGLKAFDITRPEQPVLLDWLRDGVDDPILPDGSPQPNRKGLLDDMWENEDVSVDQDRKLVFLSRDPRAYGGNTNSGESGVYIIDARHPERLEVLSYVRVPAGHTTTCINDCKWLWTNGPAASTEQQALGWGGRPVFVTDIRDPHHPKVYPEPVDLGRNDGRTDYSHDVQVDANGIAWVSGRGGVRGYWTKGLHHDPLLGAVRVATAWEPIPYAGGGISETAAPSRFMHNSWHPAGTDAGDGADPAIYGDLIYATEEDFRGGCAADGAFVIASLTGSFGGEGWRSTTTQPFRLETVGTWKPAGQPGSSTSGDCSAHYFQMQDRIVAYSFYSQGVRFLDISDPTNPIQVGYFRPNNGTSWAPYFHKGLLYTADRNGVYVLRPTVAAGELRSAVAEPAALTAASEPAADPEVERIAGLARPTGMLCSLPITDDGEG
jgi:hypothetical protein